MRLRKREKRGRKRERAREREKRERLIWRETILPELHLQVAEVRFQSARALMKIPRRHVQPHVASLTQSLADVGETRQSDYRVRGCAACAFRVLIEQGFKPPNAVLRALQHQAKSDSHESAKAAAEKALSALAAAA